MALAARWIAASLRMGGKCRSAQPASTLPVLRIDLGSTGVAFRLPGEKPVPSRAHTSVSGTESVLVAVL